MSSQPFSFSGLSSQTTSTIKINTGEKLRLRLATLAGRPQLAVQITQNGVTDTGSLLTIAAGEAVDLNVGAPGDSVAIIYTGQTSFDAVSGIIESIPAVAATLSMVGPGNLTATSTALSGTVSGTSSQTIGPFAPEIGRDAWLKLVGTAFTGTIQLLKNDGDGLGNLGITLAAGLPGATLGQVRYLWSITTPYTGVICNEDLLTMTDGGSYSLVVTPTAGSLGYRLGQ